MGYYPELTTYAYVWCEICERTPTRPHTHTPTHPYTDETPHTDTDIHIQLLSHHTHTHTHALRAYFAFRTSDDCGHDLVGERVRVRVNVVVSESHRGGEGGRHACVAGLRL